MKRTIGVIGAIGLAAVLCSCGGNGSQGLGEQTMNFGSLTTRVVGTAQVPVTLGGSGSVITGVAGATFSSLALRNAAPSLAETKIAFWSDRTGHSDIYIMGADGT